jgi:FkbM family methyltransferase
MNFIKRLTYKPEVLAVARRLGLHPILRKIYFWWARPSDGLVRVEVNGVQARFYVRTPGELRNLDPVGHAQAEYPVVEKVLSFLGTGGVFCDIGSNVGLYAILAAKKLGEQGRVLAFEPYSQAYSHLQDNIKLNEATNVTAFNKAVGETRGTAQLNMGEENADSSLVRSPTGRDLGHETVEVISMDEFIDSERLPVPRVVKIDVEGFEYSVLKGMRRTLAAPACQLVCCEVHPSLLPPEISPQSIPAFLESVGFQRIEARPRKDTFHVFASKMGQ